MKDEASLIAIRGALLGWFDAHHRRLPWRETRDPYRIWVSEVMLQQTQVNTVIPYYHRFLKRFPSLADLAAAPLDAVLRIWEGLGYYARARNLHKACREIAAVPGGAVPDDPEGFKRLPGVGDYIGAAVLSIAFGRPLAVVDGNVKRVLARLFRIDEPVNAPSAKKVYQGLADLLLETRDPGRFNQAVMELGALVCAPRNPDCGLCPVQPFCGAHRAGETDAYPRRAPARSVPTVWMVVLLIRRNGSVLLTRRPDRGLLGGLWEFPAAEIQDMESPERAGLRLAGALLQWDGGPMGRLGDVRHAYTHFKLRMRVFGCRADGAALRREDPESIRWVPWEHLGDYALHKAARKCERLGSSMDRKAG